MSDGEELAMLDELAERQAERESVASPRQGEREKLESAQRDATKAVRSIEEALERARWSLHAIDELLAVPPGEERHSYGDVEEGDW